LLSPRLRTLNPEEYSMKRPALRRSVTVLAASAILAFLGAPRHAWAQG